jgi:hypothetical protein
MFYTAGRKREYFCHFIAGAVLPFVSCRSSKPDAGNTSDSAYAIWLSFLLRARQGFGIDLQQMRMEGLLRILPSGAYPAKVDSSVSK